MIVLRTPAVSPGIRRQRRSWRHGETGEKQTDKHLSDRRSGRQGDRKELVRGQDACRVHQRRRCTGYENLLVFVTHMLMSLCNFELARYARVQATQKTGNKPLGDKRLGDRQVEY